MQFLKESIVLGFAGLGGLYLFCCLTHALLALCGVA